MPAALWVLLLAFGLAACTSVPASGLKTIAAAVGVGSSRAPAPVQGVRFMRVRQGGSESFVVFGDVDLAGSGRAEVWYSAGRQVLRLRDGRIVSSAGLPFDWSTSETSGLPLSWGGVGSEPVSYTRVRDEYPGHRMGVRERVVVRRVAAPPGLVLPGVTEQQWRAWVWFSETAVEEGIPAGTRAAAVLPAALFGVDLRAAGEPVRYSWQCLAPDVCLELQPWGEPPASP